MPLAIDTFAVRHVPQAHIPAEQIIKAPGNAAEPVLRQRMQGTAQIGFVIRAVVALDDPYRGKAAVDRQAEIGIAVAQEDAVLAPTPAIVRFQRGKCPAGLRDQIVAQPFEGEFPVVLIVDF